MSKYRRAAKVDSNQSGIVNTLRKLGYTVQAGHDDILVGVNGRTYWYEIKDESTVSVKTGEVRLGEIKQSQRDLKATWKGHYKIVWHWQQILDDIKMREDYE